MHFRNVDQSFTSCFVGRPRLCPFVKHVPHAISVEKKEIDCDEICRNQRRIRIAEMDGVKFTLRDSVQSLSKCILFNDASFVNTFLIGDAQRV